MTVLQRGYAVIVTCGSGNVEAGARRGRCDNLLGNAALDEEDIE
jgi:hypothetical protein